MSFRLSSVRPNFSFPDDNLSQYQWIFTKLGMCIDIVEIWFGIANWQISSISELSARHTIVAGYYRFTFLLLLQRCGILFKAYKELTRFNTHTHARTF